MKLTFLMLSNTFWSPLWKALNLLMIMSNDAASKSSSFEYGCLWFTGIRNTKSLMTSSGSLPNRVESAFIHCRDPTSEGGYTSASMAPTQAMHPGQEWFLVDGFLYDGHWVGLEQGWMVVVVFWCHKSIAF